MFHNYQMKKLGYKNVCLFLVGLFSYTSIRIIGTIGISELVLVILCPFVFLKDLSLIKRDRMGLLFLLSFLWLCGAILADYLAETPFEIAIRGAAFPIVTFASLTCISDLLRNNLIGLKYLIIGMFLSSIISIFAFQSHVVGGFAAGSAEALQAVVDYKLFWPLLISNILTLPIKAWYFSVPNWYAVPVTLVCAFVNLFFGGRSLFLIGLTTFILILVATKNEKRIRAIKNHILLISVAIMLTGIVAYFIYKMTVKEGYLSEAEQVKYEQQTKRGEGIIALLLSGRSDFFVSMFAAMDHPIVGLGTHALDEDGYMIEFARKYGTDVGLKQAMEWSAIMGGAPRLPMHSHLTGFWCWHGMFGGLFWLYAIYIVLKGAYKGVEFFPWSFGYLAVTLPFQIWTLLFSPYSHRVPECALIVFCAMILNQARMCPLDRSNSYYRV